MVAGNDLVRWLSPGTSKEFQQAHLGRGVTTALAAWLEPILSATYGDIDGDGQRHDFHGVVEHDFTGMVVARLPAC